MVARGALLSRLRRLRTCRRRCADNVPAVLAAAAPSKKNRNAKATTSATKHARIAGAIEQRLRQLAVLVAASMVRLDDEMGVMTVYAVL